MRVGGCVCQVIKRFVMHSKKTAFVVEHDFIMATYLADRSVDLTACRVCKLWSDSCEAHAVCVQCDCV